MAYLFHVIKAILRVHWLIFIGLAPLLIWFFNQISLIAPLINILIVPIFTILLPLALAATALALITGWYFPMQLLVSLINIAFIKLSYLANHHWVVQAFPLNPWWTWLYLIVGVIWLLAPRGLPARWVGLPLITAFYLWQPEPPANGAMHFTLLDVGQGLSAILRTHNHSLIYDVGPKFSSGFDAGEAILVPALRAYGINRIDTLIISHGDKDHAGGLDGLAANIPITTILSGEPDLIPANFAAAAKQQCLAGQTWNWDGIQFTILHPTPPLPKRANDRSCVLQATAAGNSVLLTGDLGRISERRLAKTRGLGLRSHILVAGHHGSNSSTTTELLTMVKPEWVLISAGYRNQYHFPRPQVIARIKDARAKVADNASGGALEFWFAADGSLIGPQAYRPRHAWPWTHQPAGIQF